MADTQINKFHRFLDSQLEKPDTDPLETEFINRTLGRHAPRVYSNHIYPSIHLHVASKFVSIKIKSQIEKESKCIICLENSDNMIDPIYLPCCRNKQIACRMCIKQSIDTNGNSCPVCRQDMINVINSRTRK